MHPDADGCDMTRDQYRQRAREFASRGNQLPQARLTPALVRWIRKNPRGMTYKQMAAELGVHYRTVEKVAYYETWGHVE